MSSTSAKKINPISEQFSPLLLRMYGRFRPNLHVLFMPYIAHAVLAL